MDSRTFSRIVIYIFVPALLFVRIYNTQITPEFFGKVFIYMLGIQVLSFLAGNLAAAVFKYPRSIKAAFCNSILCFNSGNYGLPLIELAFKNNPLATTSQIFIIVIQNIITNTFGVFQASSGNTSYKKALKNVLAMPSLYVLAVIIAVKALGIKVPGQVLLPLQYISDGFVGFALISLGVQLAEVNFGSRIKDAFLSSFIRLILLPSFGFLLVTALGIKGILAQALILGISTPSAVNTAMIAKEYDNEPEYAAQIVLVSTILSAVTISAVLFLINNYFPA